MPPQRSRSRPGRGPVALLPIRTAVLHLALHAAELRVEAHARTKTSSTHRSNECAGRVERQRGDVAAEVGPDSILIQILLDVRQVEGRHDRAPRFDVLADRPNRLWAGKVADNRYH